jgi:hypothetical protein
MSHTDDCPDRWTIRRQAERDAENGYGRFGRYGDCEEANREYRREYYHAEDRLQEERAEQRRAEQRAAYRLEQEYQEQQAYEQQMAEQEYWAIMEQQEADDLAAAYYAEQKAEHDFEMNAVATLEGEGGPPIPEAS